MTSQYLRQHHNLTPSQFNIYLDEFLKEWKGKIDSGIILQRQHLYMLTFATISH